jgi:hypothetical protein
MEILSQVESLPEVPYFPALNMITLTSNRSFSHQCNVNKVFCTKAVFLRPYMGQISEDVQFDLGDKAEIASHISRNVAKV